MQLPFVRLLYPWVAVGLYCKLACSSSRPVRSFSDGCVCLQPNNSCCCGRGREVISQSHTHSHFPSRSRNSNQSLHTVTGCSASYPCSSVLICTVLCVLFGLCFSVPQHDGSYLSQSSPPRRGNNAQNPSGSQSTSSRWESHTAPVSWLWQPFKHIERNTQKIKYFKFLNSQSSFFLHQKPVLSISEIEISLPKKTLWPLCN